MGLKFVRQRDSMECGAACLTMVLNTLGGNFDLRDIAEMCDVTSEGVSLRAISEVADSLGLDNESAFVSTVDLSLCPLPAILHWNQNHFVVLDRISRRGNRFHIADPGKGILALNKNDFEAAWIAGATAHEGKGIAMFFSRNARWDESMRLRCCKSLSLKFLSKYLKGYGAYLWQIGLGLLLGCVFQLVMPFLTQAIVDLGIHRSDIGIIWLILLGELLIVAGRTVTDFIRRWLLLHVSMRINVSLISDFLIALMGLPMAFFDSKLTGDLLQRMADHNRIESFLTSELLSAAFSVLSFLVFGFVLFLYSKIIFLVFIVGGVIYALWTAAFLRRRRILDYEVFEKESIIRNLTYQLVTTMQEIKLHDCRRRRRWEWEDTQADLFAIRMKALRLQQSREAGATFINEIKNILITVIAASAVINGSLSLGAMMAIQYIIGQLNSPLDRLMAFIQTIQDVKISLERISEIRQRQGEENKTINAETYAGPKDIHLDGVAFKYNCFRPAWTLQNVNCNIPEGKTTAIVGASGSGKTTILKLILGYYTPQQGRVIVAGRDIADYSPSWIRRNCGVVMQDGVIFSESIARNIAVADGDIDPQRLVHAAKTSNIHDYIMSLPLKYDTKIGRDGVGLSQGQKQRILIARAVYRNPHFLLLDEATNALDAGNERDIVRNLARFFQGKTVIVVAHRLSTVRDADNIIVVDNGKIVETGNHDSLVALRGIYFNLIRNQLELGS